MDVTSYQIVLFNNKSKKRKFAYKMKLKKHHIQIYNIKLKIEC